MDHTTTAKTCFPLLQSVLQDAFHISANFFTPPYEDFNKIDRGIRAAIWTDFQEKNAAEFFPKNQAPYRILIIQSNLGFYNILATFADESLQEFISIGPFRDNELSVGYFTSILKDSHITPAEIQKLRHLYESMPFAQVDAVVNLTKHILEAFEPAFQNITPELMQFTDEKRAVSVNNELLDAYSIEYSEQYRDTFTAFLKHIAEGSYTDAKESLQSLVKLTQFGNHKNMKEAKAFLHTLNESCHAILLQTSIHPLHILKQSASLRIRIEEEVSFKKLEQLPGEICRKYHLLVKNYTNPECSRLVKDVISYIQLHLEEELSLNLLAEHFDKNPSVLSNAFSKDMGLSLTTYIQQTRIQAAVRLFNTTDMTVSEVATAVGYQDFSYFSKLFSKHIGCSPRAYRSGKQ